MERRYQERLPSSLPIQVSTASGTWKGTCINLSAEGALLKLESAWDGAEELEFRLDPELPVKVAPSRARVIRASSPDHVGSFLAIRFLSSHGIPTL